MEIDTVDGHRKEALNKGTNAEELSFRIYRLDGSNSYSFSFAF